MCSESYVFTAVGWASAHGAFSSRDIALVAIPFAVVWTGWGIVRLRPLGRVGGSRSANVLR